MKIKLLILSALAYACALNSCYGPHPVARAAVRHEIREDRIEDRQEAWRDHHHPQPHPHPHR